MALPCFLPGMAAASDVSVVTQIGGVARIFCLFQWSGFLLEWVRFELERGGFFLQWLGLVLVTLGASFEKFEV